jgi:hypothetical protein
VANHRPTRHVVPATCDTARSLSVGQRSAGCAQTEAIAQTTRVRILQRIAEAITAKSFDSNVYSQTGAQLEAGTLLSEVRCHTLEALRHAITLENGYVSDTSRFEVLLRAIGENDLARKIYLNSLMQFPRPASREFLTSATVRGKDCDDVRRVALEIFNRVGPSATH